MSSISILLLSTVDIPSCVYNLPLVLSVKQCEFWPSFTLLLLFSRTLCQIIYFSSSFFKQFLLNLLPFFFFFKQFLSNHLLFFFFFKQFLLNLLLFFYFYISVFIKSFTFLFSFSRSLC